MEMTLKGHESYLPLNPKQRKFVLIQQQFIKFEQDFRNFKNL